MVMMRITMKKKMRMKKISFEVRKEEISGA